MAGFYGGVLLARTYCITPPIHAEGPGLWSMENKSFLLFLIMVTGAIWEKVVFGQFLFAEAFFWEDVVSFFVIFFHSLYLYVLLSGDFLPTSQMLVALFAYFLYFINAFQFLRKLRLARQTERKSTLLKDEVKR